MKQQTDAGQWCAGGDAGQNWLEGGSKSNPASLPKEVCVAGEAVTVAVQLSNPLAIPLPISRLSLLAHLQQPDHLQGAEGSILVRPPFPACAYLSLDGNLWLAFNHRIWPAVWQSS